jgi:hypothetical protein
VLFVFPEPYGTRLVIAVAAVIEVGSITAPGDKIVMKCYPNNLKFAEFITIFKERYVFEGGDGRPLIAMTSQEALLLSKYLFRGIIDWKASPIDGTGVASDLRESLESFAERNAGEAPLSVNATEEDLRALGAFLVRGLVGVFMTLDRKQAGLKYGGQ